MRYFISYPPSKTLKLIDVLESDRVEKVLELVKQEFGLKFRDSNYSEVPIGLSYNGFNLKSKWFIADLNIPSGAIIRCISRDQLEADIYVHCEFNRQILKLFNTSITIQSTVGTLRKKISDKLGIPLSTFCLETYDDKQRLYDEMKLIDYNIKIHDRVYLKVWGGYEKFIDECVKGFTEHYSHDGLTRHYQRQVALHIAAFYGHARMASSAIQQGARSDRPAGEHPSRQWSSETATQILPEMLKCPIHIAIERGHVKMVDMFVRESILCTQIRDPLRGALPYQLALFYALSAKTKEEKQRYNEIYFYLQDKQHNFKIPLNATGEYVKDLLTFRTSVNTVHRSLPAYVYISLPYYCKIKRWCENAREKAWRKFGGHFPTPTQTKRVYPNTGLLGYKVLIDGYNNKFEVPIEQLRSQHSAGTLTSDQDYRYINMSEEEKKKIIQMRTFIKDFILDDQQRTKQRAALNLQKLRRPPSLLPQTSANLQKYPIKTTAMSEGISSASEFSNSQILSSLSVIPMKPNQSILNTDNTNLQSASSINAPPLENSQEFTEKIEQTCRNHKLTPHNTRINKENKHTLPTIISSRAGFISANKPETAKNTFKQAVQQIIPSVNPSLSPSIHLTLEDQQTIANKECQLPTKNIQSKQQQQQQRKSIGLTAHSTSSTRSTSRPTNHALCLDPDSYVVFPDHPTNINSGPIRSRFDLEIHQSTIKSYGRYTSATTRSTAIDCLQEANYLKNKSWLKKIEISKSMLKNKVQQRIRRADDKINNKNPISSPFYANVTSTEHKSDILKVN